MTSSPFSAVGTNVVLTFSPRIGLLVRDASSGNMVPREGPPVKVTALLSQLSLQSALQIVRQPGVNDEAVLLAGYCVSPMILPKTVEAGTWAIAEYSGLRGQFYLNSPIHPPYGRAGIGNITEPATGTKITGWFQPDKQ
jgi:hypothetical protein